MSARQIETLRRRRERREADEAAEREYAAGGPLVEIVMGGTPDEFERSSRAFALQSARMALYFATRCCVTAEVCDEMQRWAVANLVPRTGERRRMYTTRPTERMVLHG